MIDFESVRADLEKLIASWPEWRRNNMGKWFNSTIKVPRNVTMPTNRPNPPPERTEDRIRRPIDYSPPPPPVRPDKKIVVVIVK